MKSEITNNSIKVTVEGDNEEHELELTEKFLLEALAAIKEKRGQ